MKESGNQKAIWLAAGALPGVRLFRVNSGKAWLGHGAPRRLTDGSVVLPGARPVALGMALASGDPVVGQSDLIGFRSIAVTPEMIGSHVAVFCAIECKRTEGGRISKEQQQFVDNIVSAGGIAGVANTPEEATRIIEQWSPPFL